MNVKLKRLLLPLLRAVKEGRPISFRMRSAAQQGLFLLQKPLSLKSRNTRLRREQKRATHKEETAKIRQECVARAMTNGGACECGCGRTLETWYAVMDHWKGGSGRRREQQSIETCWMLTLKCNAMRTNNSPSVKFWNAKFAAHARRYGYPVVEHIIHAEPAKAGGAP